MPNHPDNPPDPATELSLDEILARYQDSGRQVTMLRNPFKFLDAYGPEDRDIFFGREAEVEEALRHFYRKKHLLLYGESGSGKSSLVECGLRGKIAQEDALFITLRSHDDPWRQLRNSLGADPRHDDPTALVRQIARQQSRTLVLVFDQFEELFVYHEAHTRQRFARELQALINARLDLKLLFVIRQEYLAHLTELERELPALLENRLWLRRMSSEDAARAMESACDVCAVTIEAGLATRLVRRLGTEDSGIELPYLQVVMDRLYRKALEADTHQPCITNAAYEAEGRIEDILARFLAEEVERLPDPHQGRQLLKALVTGEGTKKVVTLERLGRDAANYGDDIPPDTLAGLARQLIESRILREDPRRGTLELRHDTLAATVFAWMSGLEKELLEIRQSLHNRHQEYLARRQSSEALLDAGFLDYLEPYAERLRLEPDIDAFVSRSRQHAQRLIRRRRTLLTGGFAVAFAILLGFSLWNLAERAKVALLDQGLLMRKLESRIDAWSTERPVAASLLTLRLLSLADDTNDDQQATTRTEAEARLRGLLQRLDGEGIASLPNGIQQLLVSENGRCLVVLDNAQQLDVWRFDDQLQPTGEPVRINLDRPLTAMTMDRPGRQLALADASHRLWLTDLTDADSAPRPLGGHTTDIHQLTFSPDGEWLVSAGGDMRLGLWPVAADDQSPDLFLSGANSIVSQVRFSADGRWLAAAGLDGAVRIWRWEQARLGAAAEAVLILPQAVRKLAISARGRWLAAVDHQGAMRLWRRNEAQQTYETVAQNPGITQLAFDGQQRYLALLDDRGEIRLFALNADNLLAQPVSGLQDARATHLSFNATGGWLVSSDSRHRLHGWRLDHTSAFNKAFEVEGHEAVISALSLSDSWLFTGDVQGHLRRMSLLPTHPLEDQQTDFPDEPVTTLTFDRTGEFLLGGGTHGTLKRWHTARSDGDESVQTIGNQGTRVDFIGQLHDGQTLISFSRGQAPALWPMAQAGKFAAAPQTEPPDLTSENAGETRTLLGPVGHWQASLDAQGRVELMELFNDGRPAQRRTPIHPDIRANRLRFSPSGNRLAMFGWDRRLLLFAARDDGYVESLALEGHGSLVRRVAFSPSGRWLASRELDGNWLLWDLETSGDPRPRRIALGDGPMIFDSTDNAILQADAGRLVRWPLGRSEPLVGIPLAADSLPHQIRALTLSTDATRLAVIDGDGQLWTGSMATATTSANLQPRGKTGNADQLEFSDDGHWLFATGKSGDRMLSIWSLFGNAIPNQLFQTHSGRVDISPDGRWLLLYGAEIPPRLADLGSLQPGASPDFHLLSPYCNRLIEAAFDENQGLIALNDRHQRIRWNLDQPYPWRSARRLDGEAFAEARALATDGNGSLIGAGDEILAMAEITDGDLGCPPPPSLTRQPGTPPVSLQPLADGTGFLLTREDGQVSRLVSGPQGIRVKEDFRLDIDAPPGGRRGDDFSLVISGLVGGAGGEKAPAERLLQVAWDDTGILAASLTASRRVALWQRSGSKMKRVRELPRPRDSEVTALALSGSGRWLALGMENGRIGLMDLDDQGEWMVPLLGHQQPIRQLTFNAAGDRLASGDDQGLVRLWPVGLKQLRRQACQLAGRELTRSEWREAAEGRPYQAVCETEQAATGLPDRIGHDRGPS